MANASSRSSIAQSFSPIAAAQITGSPFDRPSALLEQIELTRPCSDPMCEGVVIAAQPHHLQMGIGCVVAKMMDLGLRVLAYPARQGRDLSARHRPPGSIPNPLLQFVHLSLWPAGLTARGFARAVLAGSAKAAPHVVLAAMVLSEGKKAAADGALLPCVTSCAVDLHHIPWRLPSPALPCPASRHHRDLLREMHGKAVL